MSTRQQRFVDWFRAASPYIHVHRGKTLVVQFDDDAVTSPEFVNLIHDLALLHSLGVRLVLVFDADTLIQARAEAAGLPSQVHRDTRITSAAELEIVKAAAGQLLIEIQARLSMGLGNTPMSNAEVRVTSGNFVTAKPLGIVDGVDFKFTGDVRSIDVHSIQTNLDGHEIVLIPPVGFSVTGEAFSLESTALAAQLAVDLKAEKLIYLMEGEGVTGPNGKLLRQLTQPEAAAVLAAGTTTPVAARYLEQAASASSRGVSRVHIIDRRVDGAILRELFTRDGIGTMVTLTSFDEIRRASAADIAGIVELIRPLELDGTLVERSRERLELDIDHYTVLVRDGAIIGCAALQAFKQDSTAELACLAVHPDYHKGGRGEQLLSATERDARKGGAKQMFVLTTRAEHWFLERGFVESTVETLPMQRQQLYNYQRNSKVLVKKL
ncbi:MAG: amino-acid N-acetyltransferase [Gammaproteobacteria bacterium]|nr:amino-acid N-acetyltransferase [Gammaproteobacteria bacterium]